MAQIVQSIINNPRGHRTSGTVDVLGVAKPAPATWSLAGSSGAVYYDAAEDALAVTRLDAGTGNLFPVSAGHGMVVGGTYTLLLEAWSYDVPTAGISIYSTGGPGSNNPQSMTDGRVSVRVSGAKTSAGAVVVNVRGADLLQGNTVYFRVLIVEGEDYTGGYFDGDTATAAQTAYRWLGTPGGSYSVATTIRPKTPCGLYAASDEAQRWLPAPDENVTINTEGWGASGTYLSGGGYVRTSANRHKTYAFAWTEIDGEDLLDISDFYDGLYGDGPFFFALPGTYRNILPQSWATPRLACLDAPPLVEGIQPRALAAPQSSRGFPTASAIYNIIGTDDRRQVLPIYVPEDMVLHLGVRGSFSGTARIEYKVDGTANTLSPVSGDDLTNAFVLGPAKVELSLQGEGTASINAMTAALRATFTPPAGRFVSGQGHSGVKFPENGLSKTLVSASRDRWNAALTVKEVGQWL